MEYRVTFLVLVLFLVIHISLVSATFSFSGYTKYVNGTNMSNVNVSVEVYLQPSMSPAVVISNLSNTTGFFSLVIPNPYNNSNYSFKPVIVTYNTTSNYAEYIGQNLPDFPYEEFSRLSNSQTTFYLKPAVTLDLSAVGDSHDSQQITYLSNYTLPLTYKTGLEIINNSHIGGDGVMKWVYVNDSDCLIVLNYNRSVNTTFCNLSITNLIDFEYYDSQAEESYNFINSTKMEKCLIEQAGTALNCNQSYNLSLGNYSKVYGIEAISTEPGKDYFIISAANQSGVALIDKFYPNFTLIGRSMEPDFFPGKMEYDWNSNELRFAGNNSGKYRLYYCKFQDIEHDECFGGLQDTQTPARNFSTGEIVNALANDVYANKWYYTSGNSRNMTEINITTTSYQFNYQVKDTKLGYSVKSNFDMANLNNNVRIYLPADRNYSVMIYPQSGAFPVSIDINNSYILSQNTTSWGVYYVNKTNLNLTTEIAHQSGYVLLNTSLSLQNYTNFTVIAFLLESGNMVYKDSCMPPNMNAPAVYDTFNVTNGFYNLSLPASVLGARMLLFATAGRNESGSIVHYGGFKPVTLTYGDTPSDVNFTLYRLIGNQSNISMGMQGDPNSAKFLTAQKSLKIQDENTTNDVSMAHAEIEVDYPASRFPGSNIAFSWMADIMPNSNSNGIIEIPLFNYSIKSMQVFSPQYAPRKKSFTASDLSSPLVYFNLSQFKNKNINGNEITDVEMKMYIHKDDGSCSVPNPPSYCMPRAGGMNQTEFNPFSTVIGGGKLDFEIRKSSNNITVRYIDVDLLASGPPDASFDSNSNSSSATLEEAWRFGSQGPEIYSYVLLGVPYNSSLINSSMTMKINITKFFDESWNAAWQQSTNSTSQLTGTDYEAYASGNYASYINGTGAVCSESDSSLSSGLCYRDTTKNMVWFKIPHFSGISPSITGVATAASGDDDDGAGGSGGASTDFWKSTQTLSTYHFENGYTKDYLTGYRVRFFVNGSEHFAGVVAVTNTTATINVSSDTQQAVFNIGDEKKFEVSNDSYYDVLIKLNSITNYSASITVKRINESFSVTPPASPPAATPPSPNPNATTIIEAGAQEEKKPFSLVKSPAFWILVVIVLLVGFFLFYKAYRAKKYYYHGYSYKWDKR